MEESSSEKYRKEVDKTASQTLSAPPGSAGQTAQQNPQNQSASSGPMRPRSLYTAHTAYHDEPNNFSNVVDACPDICGTSEASAAGQGQASNTSEKTNGISPFMHKLTQQYERYGEFPKYFEPADQWMGMGGGGAAFSSTPGIWRQPRNPKPISASYYASEEGLYAGDNWRDHQHENDIVAGSGGGGGGTCGGAIATPHGTISLRLHNRIRVDMTIDRAVRVINFKNNIVLSLSGSGAAAALLHPNGRIYQYGSRVEILAHDAHGNNKYAKMWYKGVSFTSEQCALVYLVDSAGTRTTTDSFSDMSQDFSLNVFFSESRHGPGCLQEAATALGAAQYWLTDEGVENWIINNVRVSQTPDGLVRIARNSNKYQLRTSPSNGTASLTTPFLHCTASLGQTSHLFVRRGERRMHYDGTSFIVRNAGHSAGFDDNNQLKVY